jgi:hypothetical protein
VLEVAQTLFQGGTADASMIHACAEGLAKRYDASIGSRMSPMEDIRTNGQRKGSILASVVELDPRRPRKR